MRPRLSIVLVWAVFLSLPMAYMVLLLWSIHEGPVAFAAVLLASVAMVAYVIARRAPYNPNRLGEFL